MATECEQSIDLIRWGVTVGAPIISGLAGIFIGSWLSGKHAKQQRKHSYIEKQLSQFYSPLVGLRNEIEMLSELRVKIQEAANSSWQDLCAEARGRGGPEALRQLSDERYGGFKNIIEYDNRALEKQLLPAYKQMAAIFRENMWLAESETVEYFQKLLEFIDIWDRWLDNPMPGEVWEKLNHSEENLKPFYEHIEKTHKALIAKLASGEI